MLKKASVIVVIMVLGVQALHAGKGKIRVASDMQGAYVYVDGKKKAMTGEGFTSILLEEGEHIVKVEYVHGSGLSALRQEKKIFVGGDSSIKLRFKLINSGSVLTKKGIVLKKNKERKRTRDEKDGRWRNEHNILIDNKLKVMWQDEQYTKKENEAYYDNVNYVKVGFWKYAREYCTELSLNNYKDWYLPSIEQLKSLYEYSDKLVNLSEASYISTTPDIKDANKRMRINGDKSHNIGIDTVSITDEDTFSWAPSYIRCVRDMK